MALSHFAGTVLSISLIAAGSCFASAADTILGRSCATGESVGRALCVTMIGAMRETMRDGRPLDGYRACSPNDPNSLEDTYAVIDWIKAHPERQGDDLGLLTEEVLSALHPCSN